MATRFLEPGEIAGLVPMRRLLAEFGFTVNTRTRRGPCLIPSHEHTNSTPTVFSWRDDGRWYCFSRSDGGDRISLVMAVKNCSFREALTFLANLAGVVYRRNVFSRPDFERARLERKLQRRDAQHLLALERNAWHNAQDEVLGLEAIRHAASRRLSAIRGGEPERFPGEEELAWKALAEVSQQIPRATARYCAISFAPTRDRFIYVLHPQTLEAAADEALEKGFVTNARRYRFEIPL
jgi:hypothetical protein